MIGASSRRKVFDQTLEVVQNGFATPSRLTGVPEQLSGCLYRGDGTKVALSERFGGYNGDKIRSSNPDQISPPKDVKILRGRGLYLGHFMSLHYGHFITETLSTFWIFEEIDIRSFDYILFHPFVFGTSVPGYARFCLERFSIDPEQIILVGPAPVAFEELVVPERLLKLNHSADPRLRWVYARIADSTREKRPARWIYLSRRRVTARKFRRVVANEVRIEALFSRAGFEVIYPETLPFPEQIALYRDAAVMAGLSGSNLHNSIFASEGSLVIELGDPRYAGDPSPTQVLCDVISGTRARFVPFEGRFFGPRITLFDMNYLAQSLVEILREEVPEGKHVVPPAKLPPITSREILEVGSRCIKSSGGYLARQLLRKLRG